MESGGLFGVQKRIKLVAEVSGSFYAGQMAAIMGPIGSGKTTLLGMVLTLVCNSLICSHLY